MTEMRLPDHGPYYSLAIPAKTNLCLVSGGRRSDGFHELDTVFMSLSTCDQVTVRRADSFGVSVSGRYITEIPNNETNLALKAAQTFLAAVNLEERVFVHIDKMIPVAGGMAGGSADAGATLVLCDRLFDTRLGTERLREIAATLGSDVPFMVTGGVARGVGRGERLEAVQAVPEGTYTWVLAFSPRGLSTPEVFSEFDRVFPDAALRPDSAATVSVLNALARNDAIELGRSLFNNLQPVIVRMRPDLATLLDAGTRAGALGGLISGTGPTCAFLVSSPTQALSVAEVLNNERHCAGTAIVTGPVNRGEITSGNWGPM